MKTFVQFLHESAFGKVTLPSALNKLDRETRKKIDFQVHNSRFWYWYTSIDTVYNDKNVQFDSLKDFISVLSPTLLKKIASVTTPAGAQCADLVKYKYVDGKEYGIEDPCRSNDEALFRHVLLLASGYKIVGSTRNNITYLRKNVMFMNKPDEYATNHAEFQNQDFLWSETGSKYCRKPSKHVVEFRVPFEIV